MEIEWTAPGPRAANDAARAWLEWVWTTSGRRNTVRGYAGSLAPFFAHCAKTGVDPRTAGLADIMAYIRALRDHRFVPKSKRTHGMQAYSPRTIKHRVTIVSLWFNFLVASNMRRDANPVPKGSRRGAGGPAIRGLVPGAERMPWIPAAADWHAITAAMAGRSLRDRYMFVLCFDAALRRSELCGLRVEDVDPVEHLVRIRAETSKNGIERVVPFTRETGQIHMQYMHQRGPEGEGLFLSASRRNLGRAVTVETWQKMIRDVAREAGVPQLHGHALRHLSLTELARAGWERADIAAFAGHRSTQSSEVYIHLSAADLQTRFAQTMGTLRRDRFAPLFEDPHPRAAEHGR